MPSIIKGLFLVNIEVMSPITYLSFPHCQKSWEVSPPVLPGWGSHCFKKSRQQFLYYHNWIRWLIHKPINSWHLRGQRVQMAQFNRMKPKSRLYMDFSKEDTSISWDLIEANPLSPEQSTTEMWCLKMLQSFSPWASLKSQPPQKIEWNCKKTPIYWCQMITESTT